MQVVSEHIKLHNILLEMLTWLDEFCNEHNITYYLAGGTLLGAVRHQGFIPWDDDVDLMMDRDNYMRFIKIAKQYMPEHLYLQCQEFDENWHYPYTKIRLNNTVYATEFSHRFKNSHQGIFIDIFVQDKTSKVPLLSKIHQMEIKLTHAIVRYKWHKCCHLEHLTKTSGVVRFLSRFYSLKTVEKHNLAAMRRYNMKNSDRMIDSSGMHLSLGYYPQEWLGEPVFLEFEGRQFPAPSQYTDYLKYIYGNYMELPPLEDRKGHTIMEVNFGSY